IVKREGGATDSVGSSPLVGEVGRGSCPKVGVRGDTPSRRFAPTSPTRGEVAVALSVQTSTSVGYRHVRVVDLFALQLPAVLGPHLLPPVRALQRRCLAAA